MSGFDLSIWRLCLVALLGVICLWWSWGWWIRSCAIQPSTADTVDGFDNAWVKLGLGLAYAVFGTALAAWCFAVVWWSMDVRLNLEVKVAGGDGYRLTGVTRGPEFLK